MKESFKKCYNCREFQRYYTKGTKKFSPKKLGRCCVKDDTVSATSTCENFKICHRSKIDSDGALYTLNNLLIELREIKQIIEERQEEYERLQKL